MPKHPFIGLIDEAELLARTVPDVDGVPFVDVWNNYFKDVDAEQVSLYDLLESPIHVLRERGTQVINKSEAEDESDMKLDHLDNQLFLSVHTRQGGGNDECWCEDEEVNEDNHEDFCTAYNNEVLREHPQYINDRYDDYDSTYSTFIFKIDKTETEINEILKNELKARRAPGLKNHLEEISNLKRTPWSILSVNKPEMSAYTDLKKNIEEYKRKSEELKNAREVRKDFVSEIEKQTIQKDSRWSAFSTTNNSRNAYKLKNTTEIIDDFNRRKKNLENVHEMIREAEALPETSLIRKKLLDDRGSFTYKTTEKRGRRNVQVERTVQKGSELGSSLKEEQKRFDYAVSNLNDLAKIISEELSEHKYEQIDELEAKIESFDVQRLRAWFECWPGDPDRMPEPSEEF